MTDLLSVEITGAPELYKPLIVICGREEETRFLFKTMLELWNYQVAEAEEIEQLSQMTRFRTPDLVLMDLAIPLTDGLMALNSLRKNDLFEKVPIVLVSGFVQPQFRSAAFELGATEFLSKPVDFSFLEFVLDKHVNKYKDRGATTI